MIDKIKWLFKEILNTFSNKKSFLSSKRIERFLIFTIMLVMTIIFITKAIVACTLGATDFMIIIAGWLGYAGFNTVQIKKDTNDSNVDDKPQEKELLKD